MVSLIRTAVSKKKKRFTEGGFDLDLAYISPQLIAMGFPSDGLEKYYRNPRIQVQQFLNSRHPEQYKVYNLCCERGYPASHFNGYAVRYGFKDHNAPPFRLLVDCIEDMHDWLTINPENVAAIHCKAGKGRTGVVICCYLAYAHEEYKGDAAAAMAFYGQQRTKNNKGVTIPSQQRYVHYFAHGVKHNILRSLPDPQLLITEIILTPTPKISADIKLAIIRCDDIGEDELMNDTDPADRTQSQVAIQNSEHNAFGTKNIVVKDEPLHTQEFVKTVFSDPEQTILRIEGPVVIRGDCDVRLSKVNAAKPFLHFWVSCPFVQDNQLVLTKKEIDGPHKDKKHGTFDQDFSVKVNFQAVSTTSTSPIPPLSKGPLVSPIIDDDTTTANTQSAQQCITQSPRGERDSQSPTALTADGNGGGGAARGGSGGWSTPQPTQGRWSTPPPPAASSPPKRDTPSPHSPSSPTSHSPSTTQTLSQSTVRSPVGSPHHHRPSSPTHQDAPPGNYVKHSYQPQAAVLQEQLGTAATSSASTIQHNNNRKHAQTIGHRPPRTTINDDIQHAMDSFAVPLPPLPVGVTLPGSGGSNSSSPRKYFSSSPLGYNHRGGGYRDSCPTTYSSFAVAAPCFDYDDSSDDDTYEF